MTLTAKTLCLAALLALPLAVHADPWKDESGHGKWRGHHHGGDYKEEYWDGNCKVERKFKGNGDYKGRAQVQGTALRVLRPGAGLCPAGPGLCRAGTGLCAAGRHRARHRDIPAVIRSWLRRWFLADASLTLL
ncbi:hypothetical protein [Cupriavidus sp. H18C1]|uniref:hypothetical protein n=1 Tax=Cupriavidus sp. H18C1 TaxID=3241601 RepID=UPI003BB8CAB3